MEESEANIWDGDVLNRQKIAEDFTRIVLSLKAPQVVGINGGYGTGKSFFVERWHKALKRQGYTTLLFNAWENDFSGDPLTAFVVALCEELNRAGLGNNASEMKGLLKSVGRILYYAGQSAARSFADKASAGLIDIEGINKEEKTQNTLEKYGNFMQSKLDEHLAVREGISNFKEHLGKAIEKINKEDSTKKKPVIVFVDELDRCRPDFAIELLENIKHIFNVPDFLFVLSMDRSQLKHAVGVIYGQNMDGEGYLRRFVDFELKLPRPDNRAFSEMLFDEADLESLFNGNVNVFTDVYYLRRSFTEYSEFFELTLREQKQIFKEMDVSLRRIEGGSFYPIIFGFFAILRVKDNLLYNQIGTSLTDVWSIIEKIETMTGKTGHHLKEYSEAPFSDAVIAFLLVALNAWNDLLQFSKEHESKRKSAIYEGARGYVASSYIVRPASDPRHRPMFIEDVKNILDIGASYSSQE